MADMWSLGVIMLLGEACQGLWDCVCFPYFEVRYAVRLPALLWRYQEVLDEARSLEAEKVVESTTWCPRCVREK